MTDGARLPWIGRRVLAEVIDLAPGLVGVIILGTWRSGVASQWNQATGLGIPEWLATSFVAAPELWFRWMIAAWWPVVVYHGVWALVAPSPGMLLVDLRVVGPDGGPATRLRRLVRALAYWAWPCTLFLGAIAVPISREQRGITEICSRTWVVTRSSLSKGSVVRSARRSPTTTEVRS